MQNSEPAANGIQAEGSPGANPIPKQENSRDDKVAEIVGSIMLILPFFLLAIPFNLALDHSGTAAYAAFEEGRIEVTRQLEIATGSEPRTVTDVQQQCSYFTSREGKRRRETYHYDLQTSPDTWIQMCDVRARTPKGTIHTTYLALYDDPHLIKSIIGPNWKLQETRLDLQDLTEKSPDNLVLVRNASRERR